MSRYNSAQTGSTNNSVTLDQPLSGFGEQIITGLEPQVQIDAVYGIRDAEVEILTGSSGAVSVSSSMFVCNCGTNVGGYGIVRSRRVISYRAGQATVGRFTALFDTTNNVSLSQQRAGLANISDGYFFGYNGSQFSILRQHSGIAQQNLLSVTSGETSTNNVDVTLNGTTTTVSLDSGSAAETARQLAAYSYTGWDAYQTDTDKVLFVARTVNELSGAFTFSGTGSAGTFSTIVSGAASQDDWIAQTSWNGDKVDGTGDSGVTIDPSKGNVYQFNIPFLGYGTVTAEVMNPDTGKWIVVHKFKYPNSSTTPHQGNPNYRLGWYSISLGSTTDITVRGASAAGFVAGVIKTRRSTRSTSNTVTGVTATKTNVLTLRNTPVINSSINYAEIKPISLAVANEGSKNAIVTVYKNADVAGPVSFTYIKEGDSIAEVDTTGTTVTNGEEILNIVVAGNSSQIIQFDEADYLSRTDKIVISAQVPGGGAGQDISVGLVFSED